MPRGFERMKLLVVSHKECWAERGGRGFVTVGGFPLQMEAISALFAETRVMITRRDADPPAGARRLSGHRLTVDALPEPLGRGWRRKLMLLFWLPRHGLRLWSAIRRADAVHAMVPGDVGLIGLILALIQRRRLWVRHCGTWGNRTTTADRLLAWLLPRIAGGRNVVMATGGGPAPPSPRHPDVTWIFSTTLREGEIAALVQARPWRAGEPPRLAQVGRMTSGKNARSTLEALARIHRQYPDARLEVAGDGPELESLRTLAADLALERHVTFHGNLDHHAVLDLLARSHLFVFPTRVAEGFPKAVLEAMACGLPVIVPAVSVLPHLASGAGAVLSDTNPETIARTVIELLADAGRIETLGHGAREAARRYSLEGWQRQIEQRLGEAWGPISQTPAAQT